MTSYVESGYIEIGYIEGDGVKTIPLVITINNPTLQQRLHVQQIGVNLEINTPFLVRGVRLFIDNIPISIIANSPIVEIKNFYPKTILLETSLNSISLFVSKNVSAKDILISTNSVTLSQIRYMNSVGIDIITNPITTRKKKNLEIISQPSIVFTPSSFAYKNINSEKRVESINGININPPLIYEKNFSKSDYISQSILAIDGSSIVSVLKKGKFANEFEISGNFVHKDTINSLFENISENIFEIEFNDGSITEAKYDLLNNPITATPLYEGAEYYNLTIRILV